MQVEIKIDDSCIEPKVIIITDKVNDEINDMYWMPHNFWGIAGYIAIFFFIYFFIWFSQYFAMKKRIQELNEKVKAD